MSEWQTLKLGCQNENPNSRTLRRHYLFKDTNSDYLQGHLSVNQSKITKPNIKISPSVFSFHPSYNPKHLLDFFKPYEEAALCWGQSMFSPRHYSVFLFSILALLCHNHEAPQLLCPPPFTKAAQKSFCNQIQSVMSAQYLFNSLLVHIQGSSCLYVYYHFVLKNFVIV